MTAVAGVAAAVVGAVALPASAADHDGRSHRPRVYISDVQYRPSVRDDRSFRSLNGEWVEITNDSWRAVNLDGWTLADEDGHTYTFRHYRLDGRATVRVHTGYGRDTREDLYQDRRAGVWDNSDTATLRTDRGRLVDETSWGWHRDHRGQDRRHGGDHRGGHRH
ncbi:lamin tail domain-containing protein [Streptomyces actinomycinicus]|uniref:Lamin tail domain-containing protein n=1 Tax=Streptomyces actinomycinicus TaxID=1695166 RepID=A0A937EFZ0_9ACTN|nr:lamin tail domain-containing protein [Streptomyces actinomycinicus]MBL1082312.1 lamin tail domain-containing protein [Streptomyces actinomycinicus]